MSLWTTSTISPITAPEPGENALSSADKFLHSPHPAPCSGALESPAGRSTVSRETTATEGCREMTVGLGSLRRDELGAGHLHHVVPGIDHDGVCAGSHDSVRHSLCGHESRVSLQEVCLVLVAVL